MGILVGALAIGFSAFKSSTVEVKYYRTSGSANSTTASDYHYRPGAECLDSPVTNCSFSLNKDSAPTLNASPTQSEVDNAIILQGTYSE